MELFSFKRSFSSYVKYDKEGGMESKETNTKGVAISKDLIDKLNQEFEELHQLLQKQDRKLKTEDKNDAILAKLYDQNVIEHEGNLL